MGNRNGLSLMEVIFAIGILLAGLVGLAAVLPVATNNALETLNRTRAEQLARNQGQIVEMLTESLSVTGGTRGFIAATNTQVEFDHDIAISTGGGASVFEPTPDIDSVPGVGDEPETFCFDPWFITAASTLRPVTNQIALGVPDPADTNSVNAYDRSVFPCYDDRYAAGRFSPAAQLSSSQSEPGIGWSLEPNEFNPTYVSARRVPRVGYGDVATLPVSLNPLYSELLTKDRDTVSVIKPPLDTTQGAGLFVKQRNSSDRSSMINKGRYSYIITKASSGGYRVVTFLDRNVVIDAGGTFASGPNGRHNLAPYAADNASQNNIPRPRQTFGDERVGYVTSAPGLIESGQGTFTFAVHDTIDPTVSIDDWICLIRRNYRPGPPLNPNPASLEMEWFRVRAVVNGPTVDSANNRTLTQVDVSGPNWTFHPIQTYGRTAGPYPSDVNSPQPNGFNNENYDATVVSGDPMGSDNRGHTLTPGDPLYGTIVVLMKDVIQVDRL